VGFMVDRGTLRQVLLRVFRHTHLQNNSINVPFRLSLESHIHNEYHPTPRNIKPTRCLKDCVQTEGRKWDCWFDVFLYKGGTRDSVDTVVPRQCQTAGLPDKVTRLKWQVS
jgi:hypothetical protein